MEQMELTQTRDRAVEVIALQCRGDAVYSLTKRLSLTAELRAPILAGATRWYGYTSQPRLLQGGLQFTF